MSKMRRHSSAEVALKKRLRSSSVELFVGLLITSGMYVGGGLRIEVRREIESGGVGGGGMEDLRGGTMGELDVVSDLGFACPLVVEVLVLIPGTPGDVGTDGSGGSAP